MRIDDAAWPASQENHIITTLGLSKCRGALVSGGDGHVFRWVPISSEEKEHHQSRFDGQFEGGTFGLSRATPFLYYTPPFRWRAVVGWQHPLRLGKRLTS